MKYPKIYRCKRSTAEADAFFADALKQGLLLEPVTFRAGRLVADRVNKDGTYTVDQGSLLEGYSLVGGKLKKVLTVSSHYVKHKFTSIAVGTYRTRWIKDDRSGEIAWEFSAEWVKRALKKYSGVPAEDLPGLAAGKGLENHALGDAAIIKAYAKYRLAQEYPLNS